MSFCFANLAKMSLFMSSLKFLQKISSKTIDSFIYQFHFDFILSRDYYEINSINAKWLSIIGSHLSNNFFIPCKSLQNYIYGEYSYKRFAIMYAIMFAQLISLIQNTLIFAIDGKRIVEFFSDQLHFFYPYR